MENNYGLKISVDEATNNLNAQFDGVEATKSTARTVLSTASLIIALISILNLDDTPLESGHLQIYQIGMILVILIYGILLFSSLSVLMPIEMNRPIASEWKEFEEHFFKKDEERVLAEQLNAYINAHKLNEVVLQNQHKYSRVSGYSLGVIVIILLFLTIITR